jgi:hypothetical protein
MFDRRETAMGPRNSHLETLRRTQTVGDCPKRTVGRLPVNDEHVPHPMHVEQRISTNEETLGKAVRNAVQQINASTI